MTTRLPQHATVREPRPAQGTRDVWLVVARELRTRVRSRTFQVATVISVVVVCGAIILPNVSSNPLRSVVRVGVVDVQGTDIEETLDRVRPLVGVGTIDVSDHRSRRAAEDALRAEEIHLAVIGREAIVSLRPLEPNDASPKGRVAQVLSVLPAITGTPTPIDSLLPPESSRPGRLTAFFGAILTYTFVFTYGSMVLGGVAEEKGTRVIEILLAAVPPKRLFAGKLIGVGLVAMLQGGIIAGAALVSASLTSSQALTTQPVAVVASMLGWFLLAYAFYAAAYAAAGSTVSRAEDASGLAFPIGLPLIIAYIASAGAMGGDDSRLLRVLSFLPPTAPVAMPMRVAIGVASPLQALIAVAVTLAGVVVVVRLGAAIYERSILRVGARIKLRHALRAPA